MIGCGGVVPGVGLMGSFVIAVLACGFAALCYAEFFSTIPVST